MKRVLSVLLVGSAALLSGDAAHAAVRRFALVAGANNGGSGRPALRYAVSDADRFYGVLVDLGGVAAADAVLLRQPRAGELDQSLAQLRERVARAHESARATGDVRTEVLVYYSGHADEKGLLLGEDRYSYRSLRDHLDALPADVRIAVLDACASGAITRIKGGQKRAPFLVDESADMRGHAFLTSSSETEAAQESDGVGGSYFTHFLLSGLRGAADASGEGKVTLNEAYQFAFNETLGRTVDTKGGAQHPSYDINLSGTGDVVITDLRETRATLVLGETLDGRFFVRNARRELVVELQKPYGRRIELGLEPGRYEVRVEREAAALVAQPEIGEGARHVMEPAQFSPTRLSPTRRRGGFDAPALAVAGRNRLDARFGLWRKPHATGEVVVGSDSGDVQGGLRYTRFVSEALAVSLGVDVAPGMSGVVVGAQQVLAGDSTLIAVPLSAQWNPLRSQWHGTLRPHLSLGLGPVIGLQQGASTSSTSTLAGERTELTIGGHLGAGLDVHLGGRFSIGLEAGYRWMADFPEPIGPRDNFSGLTVALNVGWLFGRGLAGAR